MHSEVLQKHIDDLARECTALDNEMAQLNQAFQQRMSELSTRRVEAQGAIKALQAIIKDENDDPADQSNTDVPDDVPGGGTDADSDSLPERDSSGDEPSADADTGNEVV